MPVIGGTGRGNDPRLPRERIDDARSSAGAPTTRALVPVSPVRAGDGMRESPYRAAPDFVAHLAATRLRAPQTRAVRRAEPAEAVAVYGSMLVTPLAAGRVFRRSV